MSQMGSHFNNKLKNENTKINLILSQLGSHFNNELKNSKVFEQKGDLLNFKANIDSMSQAEPS